MAELHLLREMTTDGLSRQQQHGVKWCCFPLTHKNRKWPKFKHAEGDNKGQLRKRKERRKDHRTVEEGKQVIPPSSPGKAVEQGRDSAPRASAYVYSPSGGKPRAGLVSRLLSRLVSRLHPWLMLGRGIRLLRASVQHEGFQRRWTSLMKTENSQNVSHIPLT